MTGREATVRAVTVRAASRADEPAIERILIANDEPIAWPGVAGLPYLDFLIDHNTTAVAEIDGAILGFAASVRAGGISHLCDLFVDPTWQGRGLGRELLGAVMPAQGPRTTFASADPRALPLYARSGMRPSWPLLYLQGQAAGLPAPAAASVVRQVFSRVPIDEARATEAALTGVDRPRLAAYQAALPGATPFVVTVDGSLAAVGLARDGRRTPGRVLDRLVVTADADPTDTLLAALRGTADGIVTVTVPGPHPALPALLDAGFRIVDRDTYCETEPGLIDPARRIPNTGFL